MISRSGRRIKKPVIYSPEEELIDDYKEDEYDSDDDDSDIDTDDEIGSEDDYEDNDEDADDDGNLKDFVVGDDDD